MCETLKIIYKCGHHERRRTKCSKFTKRKTSLGNKIFGYYDDRNDCGSVHRERSRTARNCDNCSAKVEGLVSGRAAGGANLGHRSRVDRTPPRREHRNAARVSPRRARLDTPRPRGFRHREASPIRSSIRPPAHDYPTKPADQPRYGRPSAPAPPVAPPRTEERERPRRLDSRPRRATHKSSRGELRSRPREGYVTRRSSEGQDDAPGVLSVSANRKPAFDRTSAHLHPTREPAVPAPASRRGSLHSQQQPTGLRPFHSRAARSNTAGGFVASEQKGSIFTVGQQNASRLPAKRPAPQTPLPPPPKPFYEVYLDAQKEMERTRASRPLGVPSRAPPAAQRPLPAASSSASKQAHKPSTKAAEKKGMVQRMAGSMGINANKESQWLPFRFGPQSINDTDSAVSFVCGRAREIERGG